MVDKAQTYLNIAFEARKGNAGRENTFFWYVTNGLGGDPVYGEVIMPNITDASGKFIHKINKKLLNQYILVTLVLVSSLMVMMRTVMLTKVMFCRSLTLVMGGNVT